MRRRLHSKRKVKEYKTIGSDKESYEDFLVLITEAEKIHAVSNIAFLK